MTTIKAEIICDSVNNGNRLTTMLCTYPLVIHAEVMTHRMFSRNAASSRAIPAKRLIEDVERDPFVPLYWGKNEPGMQASKELVGETLKDAIDIWHTALDRALDAASGMAEIGAHKQIVNRLLAPFAHIRTLITATDWGNFFKLRCHDAAEPHMHMLADAMHAAINASAPQHKEDSGVHLPFVGSADASNYSNASLELISAARCARVSYRTQEGELPNAEKDLALAEKLSSSGHWSPFEHIARPKYGRCANFMGWQSLRRQMGA
jgi:thymidylate synthase ThyX